MSFAIRSDIPNVILSGPSDNLQALYHWIMELWMSVSGKPGTIYSGVLILKEAEARELNEKLKSYKRLCSDMREDNSDVVPEAPHNCSCPRIVALIVISYQGRYKH